MTTTTTDETTHLRALLVEQTAQASRVMALLERAEFAFHAAIERAKKAEALVERAELARARAEAERDHALAANAEMRAALGDWHGPPNPEHSVEHCPTCALLSRPDLGAGMVVVPREVVAIVLDALNRVPSSWGRTSAEIDAIADLEASLKKGGG